MATPIGEFLRNQQFTSGLPEHIQNRLASLARVEEFPKDGVIFREGTQNFDLFVIISGHLALEVQVPTRGPVKFLSLGPGDLTGWSVLLTESPMTATAVALEPVKVLTIPARALRELCEQDYEVGYHVMRQVALALSKRLGATRVQMLDLVGDATTGMFYPML